MSNKVRRALLIVTILVAAIGVAALLTQSKPPPETKESDDVELLVDVMPLEATTIRFSVETQGTVMPGTETILSAEIAGAIVKVSPKFTAGGVFGKDEELLRIDPTNYTVAVDKARALVNQRQVEYDGILKLQDKGYRSETELASAAAALASARAELVGARRNLERTSIRLPYAGIVRAKEADLGQYVNPGSRLGVTFSTDRAEIRLPLTANDLAFLQLPDAAAIAESGAAEGPGVTLSVSQNGEVTEYLARIVRTEGVVDEKNRVTYAVAEIDDPYGLDSKTTRRKPLPIGSFVRARIDGVAMDDVIRVPRLTLKNGNQLIFVDAESRLRIQQVDVIRSDADFAYIRGDTFGGERISLTAIETPINGTKVRTGDEITDGQLASGARP